MSGLTFRSLIYFEFIFVYGVRESSNFILLHVAVQFSQHHFWGFPGGTVVKNPPANAGDTGSIPWSGKISHAAEQLSP